MQLQVKTILNAIQHFPGFVFQDIRLQRHRDGRPRRIEIALDPHGGTWRALRSRIEPMKKVARTLRSHEALLMNWFKAKGEISSAAVEGLNNKIRVVTRRSYGFRTYDAMEMALYHTLGRLPEPESAHRFC